MTNLRLFVLLSFAAVFCPTLQSIAQEPVKSAESTSGSRQKDGSSIQMPDPLEAMRKLSFLAGKWKGDGWIQIGPGERRTFTETELVQPKVKGAAVLIEGLGKGRIPGKEEPVTIHDAFALMWYDGKSSEYRFLAFRADGGNINATANVGDHTLVWGFRDARAGDLRFTISLNEKGQWFEIGENSRDGKSWQKFFEMTLDRLE